MGSSSGGNYSQPKIPAPPADMIAGPGQTAPFNPQYVNFLGDTNTPSTGLTPEMLAQIDQGVGQGPPPGMGGGGGDRGLLAEIMAMLKAQQQPQRGMPGMQRDRFGGGDRGGNYSTSGREGAGSFGSRSSSASRAGGGLY